MSGYSSSSDSDDPRRPGPRPGPPPPPGAVAAKKKRRKKTPPQVSINRIWARFSARKFSKALAVLPFAPVPVPTGPERGTESLSLGYERAAEECRRKVKKIIQECRRVNMRYRDPGWDLDWDLKMEKGYCLNGLGTSKFEISGSSMINPSSTVPKAVKRVHEIFEKPTFLEKLSPSDVKQGHLGDCWLMASLAALANVENGIRRICVEHDTKIGIYGFVFYRDGEWIYSIVDDKLYLKSPCWDSPSMQRDLLQQIDREDVERVYRQTYQTGSKALFFAQCKAQNETWLPLVEKAYAKAHNDYAALQGGWIGEGLEDLTGGVTTELLTSDILDTEGFWETELSKVNEEFLFGCSTGLLDGGYGDRDGISEGHAYVVMEARTLKNGTRLLKLRNPWGKGRKGNWEGAWSDGSKEWTTEVQEELGHSFASDSVFWIAYEDLLRKYQHFDRTRLFRDPDWVSCQRWIGVEVPWKAQYNEKFHIKLTKESPMVLVLSQLDNRYFKGLSGQYTFRLHFRLHEKDKAGAEDYIVRSHGNYLMDRSVSVEVPSMLPGEYSVFISVVGERDSDQPSVEDVVRRECKKRTENEKLAQVGYAYDLAHAKAAYHLEQVATARRRQERRRASDNRKRERRRQWEKRHLQRDLGKRQEAKNKEKRDKRAAEEEETRKKKEAEEEEARKKKEAAELEEKTKKEAEEAEEKKKQEDLKPKDKAVQTEAEKIQAKTTDDKAVQTGQDGKDKSEDGEGGSEGKEGDKSEGKDKEGDESKGKDKDNKEGKDEKTDEKTDKEDKASSSKKSKSDKEKDKGKDKDKKSSDKDSSSSESDSSASPQHTPKSHSSKHPMPLKGPLHPSPYPPRYIITPSGQRIPAGPGMAPPAPHHHAHQPYMSSDGESSASPISDWEEYYSGSDDAAAYRARLTGRGGPSPPHMGGGVMGSGSKGGAVLPGALGSGGGGDSDDDNESDPWNAVCIVGIRIYCKDEGLELRVVMEGGELAEGGMGEKGEQDLDNAQANAAGGDAAVGKDGKEKKEGEKGVEEGKGKDKADGLAEYETIVVKGEEKEKDEENKEKDGEKKPEDAKGDTSPEAPKAEMKEGGTQTENLDADTQTPSHTKERVDDSKPAVGGPKPAVDDSKPALGDSKPAVDDSKPLAEPAEKPAETEMSAEEKEIKAAPEVDESQTSETSEKKISVSPQPDRPAKEGDSSPPKIEVTVDTSAAAAPAPTTPVTPVDAKAKADGQEEDHNHENADAKSSASTAESYHPTPGSTPKGEAAD